MGSLEEAFPPSGCSNGSFLLTLLARVSTYCVLASGQVLHCMIPKVQSDKDLGRLSSALRSCRINSKDRPFSCHMQTGRLASLSTVTLGEPEKHHQGLG